MESVAEVAEPGYPFAPGQVVLASRGEDKRHQIAEKYINCLTINKCTYCLKNYVQ